MATAAAMAALRATGLGNCGGSSCERMSDCCLQGIQPCKCKRKGIDELVIRSLDD
jgi:hypothetical protein